jgi:hypothetical protein
MSEDDDEPPSTPSARSGKVQRLRVDDCRRVGYALDGLSAVFAVGS